MKKTIALFSAGFLLLFGACKKDSKTTPTPPPTPPPSPYYFKSTFLGVNYNLNANFPQYMTFYANEVGGYQVADLSLFPSFGLSISWPNGDTVRESDIMGLVGKTLYFNDTVHIFPSLTFDQTSALGTWYSKDTTNESFNVKITNVTFLKKDTTLGTPLRTYVATGSCNAIMYKGDSTATLSAGQFNFVISRIDL
jgi:hypothetical protein